MKLRKREIVFYTILIFAIAVTATLLVTAKSIKKQMKIK